MHPSEWSLVLVSLEGGCCALSWLVCWCWWFILVLRGFPALQIKQSVHGGFAVPEDAAQFPPSPVAGAENFTERNGLTSKFRTDGATQEFVVVENPDFPPCPWDQTSGSVTLSPT